jgi:hypothetical protein
MPSSTDMASTAMLRPRYSMSSVSRPKREATAGLTLPNAGGKVHPDLSPAPSHVGQRPGRR